MIELDLNPNVNKTPPDPRNLILGQVRRYGRKSNKEGRAQKSLQDQCSCTLITCKTYGLPTSEADWIAEPVGSKGSDWWIGGGTNGLEEPDPDRKYREVLTQLLQDVISQKVRAVVVFNLDRLFRDVEIAKSLISILFKYNCLLFDFDGSVNIWTHQGRNAILQNAISSQALSENSRINSPRGVRENIKMGKLVVSPNVQGFRSAGQRTGGILHIEEEQAVVLRMYEMCDAGMSTLDIANTLMGEGMRLHSFSGGQNPHGHTRTEGNKDRVYMSKVRKILRDCRYVGRQRWNGEEYPCPAFLREVECEGEIRLETVVPEALWNRVQVKLDGQKRIGNRAVNKRVLASLVRCGLDGTVLTAQESKCKNGTKVVHWITKTHNRNLVKIDENSGQVAPQFLHTCEHSLPSVRVPVLDDYICDVLGPLMAADLAERLSASRNDAVAVQRMRLEQAIQEAERYKREELPRYAVTSLVSPALLASMEREINEKIAKLHDDLAGCQQQEQALANAPQQLQKLRNVDEGLKRDVIRKCIVWIAVFDTPGPRERKPGYRCDGYSYAPKLVGKLVFLTAWGTYHTAVISRERQAGFKGYLPFKLRPANVEESIGGICDFPQPDRFFNGLRNAWEGRGYVWSPEKFAPGYVPGVTTGVPEFTIDADAGVSPTSLQKEVINLPKAA